MKFLKLKTLLLCILGLSTIAVANTEDDDDLLLLIPSIIAAIKNKQPPPPPPPPEVCEDLEFSVIDVPTTINKGCYNVKNTVFVDALLTLKPGVKLKFDNHRTLIIRSAGALKAVGTSSERVIFTGRERSAGYWNGVDIGSSNINNVIRYATIEYAGGGNSCRANLCVDYIDSDQSRLALSDTVLQHSSQYGFVFEDANITVFDRVYSRSNNRPGFIQGNDLYRLTSTSRFNGNTEDFVYVDYDIVTTPQTWHKLNVPYHLESQYLEVLVNVEPGVELKFFSGDVLHVRSSGALAAVGTELDPIVLTGAVDSPGYWDGLYFYLSNSDANELKYVEVSNAGSSTSSCNNSNICLSSSSSTQTRIKMSHVTTRDSLGYGLWIAKDTIIDEFSNVTTTANNRSLYVNGNDVRYLGTDSNYSGNVNDYIFVDFDTVTIPQTWRKLDVPYHLETQFLEALLSLEAGVELKFYSNQVLQVRPSGALSAVGSELNPIILTGVVDSPGYWDGLYFYLSASEHNQLTHVEVKNAGSSVYSCANSNICLYSTISSQTRIKMSNVKSHLGLGYGLWIQDDTVLDEFSGITLTSNSRPLLVSGNDVRYLNATSNYSGNLEDFVYVAFDTVTDPQTWRNLGVPYHLETQYLETLLTVEPGVNMKFRSGDQFYVRSAGALSAIGTEQHPIMFEGTIDSPGYWNGLYFSRSNSVNNRLERVVVSNGGGGGSAEYSANIELQCSSFDPGRLSVINSEIKNSLGWGIIANDTGCSLSQSGNSFSNNASGDIKP